MKTLSITAALSLSVLFACSQQATRMNKQWETGPGLMVPESVLYDSVSGNIFVSNIAGKSSAKDTIGFISTLSMDGEILDLQWVKGLDAPKGMGILDNHLFVTNLDEVVEIDIVSATILKRIPVPGSTFLNDIAIDHQTGTIYISETRLGKVFILKNGHASTWLEGEKFEGANGLFLREGYLYIGTAFNILMADLITGEAKIFAASTGKVDGLYITPDKKYIYSDWNGSITLSGSQMPNPEVLLNTSAQKINAADFGIIRSQKLILVPTFSDNKVVCYSLPDIR
jgi:hypothetical protein